MKKGKIIPVAIMLWVIAAAFTVNSRWIWPGEAWLEGVTNVDGLKQVFEQHTSAYDRRYLFQALPYFCKDHQITVLPQWLVQETALAIEDPDPLIVIEGIIFAKVLNLSELSPNLARTYMRARQMSFENMPKIHLTTVSALGSFNNSASKNALNEIVNHPLPAQIFTDVLPALRVLSVLGDSTSVPSLDLLKSRVQVIKDSVRAVESQKMAFRLSSRADSLQAKSDSVFAIRTDAMTAFVDSVKHKIMERTGKK